MTATVIVFFHAVITVGNESVFSKTEKYPPTIFHIPITRQVTGEKILKQHRNATAITYRITPLTPRAEKEKQKSKRKNQRKVKDKEKS